MSEFHPQVVIIEQIKNHPNGDNLDIATVLSNYPVIVKRDEYKVGDKAAYIPVDAIVPSTEYFHFLCPKQYEQYEDENGNVKNKLVGDKYTVGNIPEKNRIIKAKKIRNVFSMGMLVPCPPELEVGTSITELFGLKKWEEEEEDNIPNQKRIGGANAEKPPTGWTIPYYDIEGLRKYVGCLGEDEEVVLTEKLNGCNFAACWDGERLWIKSRNYFKRRDENDQWWDVAFRLDLETKLQAYPNRVFFGELVGNVKNFRYDVKIENNKLLTKVYFFDIYDTATQYYLDYDDFTSVIKSVGLESTPELYRGKWLGKELMFPYAEGKTTLGKNIREGFVVKPTKERYEPRLDGRMQAKLIGEGYQLQK